MTITEIIAGLQEVQLLVKQSTQPSWPPAVETVCRLSKNLALHVQQLELDMRNIHTVVRVRGGDLR